eukprot:3244510-Pleurochrysis_carterae.AAC.1
MHAPASPPALPEANAPPTTPPTCSYDRDQANALECMRRNGRSHTKHSTAAFCWTKVLDPLVIMSVVLRLSSS